MVEENSGGLHADVLKVGHHGSKNSTTQEFLDAVAPTIAIISSGEDNPYGHPSPELLERLETSGGAGIENGPRWNGAYFDGWRPVGNFLLCGMCRIGDCDYFKTCGTAKSEPEQSAIAGTRRLLAIRDFFYIE